MTTSKKLRLASIFTYLGHFLIVFAVSLILFISALTVAPDAEGWDAFGVGILLVLSVLGFLYAAGLVLPLLFSALAYRRERRGLIIACLPFDACYILLTLFYTLNFHFDGDIIVCLILAVLLALSVAPFVLNILILKAKTAPQVAETVTEGE